MDQYFKLNQILDDATKLVLGACTSTMNGCNGGNGINAPMAIIGLRPNLPKLLKIALNKKTLIWVFSLSSDRLVQ